MATDSRMVVEIMAELDRRRRQNPAVPITIKEVAKDMDPEALEALGREIQLSAYQAAAFGELDLKKIISDDWGDDGGWPSENR